jgi:hypothetical protein
MIRHKVAISYFGNRCWMAKAITLVRTCVKWGMCEVLYRRVQRVCILLL